ncbi:MAG: hypothetical protein AB7E72_06765 [Lysobacterales bacterium]
MSEKTLSDLPFLIFEEVRDGAPYAGELFQRKFHSPIPDYPYHFIALYRATSGSLHVASYGHVMLINGMGMGGGSCTDERVLRLMSSAERDAIRAAGGLHCLLIRYIFQVFAKRAPILFAYCGDKRAELVDLRAGFERTEHPFLFRRVLAPMEPADVEASTERAFAFGPF